MRRPVRAAVRCCPSAVMRGVDCIHGDGTREKRRSHAPGDGPRSRRSTSEPPEEGSLSKEAESFTMARSATAHEPSFTSLTPGGLAADAIPG